MTVMQSPMLSCTSPSTRSSWWWAQAVRRSSTYSASQSAVCRCAVSAQMLLQQALAAHALRGPQESRQHGVSDIGMGCLVELAGDMAC